jgi:hypothetical protein
MLENLHVKNPMGLLHFGPLVRSSIVRYAVFACWYLSILQSDFDKIDTQKQQGTADCKSVVRFNFSVLVQV